MKKLFSLFFVIFAFQHLLISQPNWPQIKANATFKIADTSTYNYPEILSINLGGWEDGLYISRDGKNLYSTYLPIDVLSWVNDWYPCIDFNPYYRGPLLGIDTVYNIFGCTNYMHSDIVKAARSDTSYSFNQWQPSNLKNPMTFDGAACGVLLTPDTFDVFVFTTDNGNTGMDIMFLKNVPTNPNYAQAVPILSSPQQEDNPHIERLSNGDLLLFFDRDRFIYYALSSDNGVSWTIPTLITNVINDQAPYDIQPHLWNDGTDWWVYFCADDSLGFRSIYRSKQTITNDWNSWAPKELVLSPTGINGGFGNVIGIGEPSLTEWGDLYFVTVYGNTMQPDTTDVFDCDPWVMKRKQPIVSGISNQNISKIHFIIYPNPTKGSVYIEFPTPIDDTIEIIDISGRVLYYKHLNGQNIELDVSNLPRGMYLLKLKNNPLVTQRLIIE